MAINRQLSGCDRRDLPPVNRKGDDGVTRQFNVEFLYGDNIPDGGFCERVICQAIDNKYHSGSSYA